MQNVKKKKKKIEKENSKPASKNTIIMERGMAMHSSILAWRILCTEEPGRLKSTGSDMTE